MPPRRPCSHLDCLSIRPSQGPWPCPRALSRVLRLAQNAADSLSPRLSPLIGSRERQLPEPHSTTSTTQDLGGRGGWGLGAGPVEADSEEKTPAHYRRSNLRPYGCQRLREAPISSFYLCTPGCLRLPGN